MHSNSLRPLKIVPKPKFFVKTISYLCAMQLDFRNNSFNAVFQKKEQKKSIEHQLSNLTSKYKYYKNILCILRDSRTLSFMYQKQFPNEHEISLFTMLFY